jgi:hypothetical protein
MMRREKRNLKGAHDFSYCVKKLQIPDDNQKESTEK